MGEEGGRTFSCNIDVDIMYAYNLIWVDRLGSLGERGNWVNQPEGAKKKQRGMAYLVWILSRLDESEISIFQLYFLKF